VKFFAEEAARLFAAAEFPFPSDPTLAKWQKESQERYVKFFKQMGETVGRSKRWQRRNSR